MFSQTGIRWWRQWWQFVLDPILLFFLFIFYLPDWLGKHFKTDLSSVTSQCCLSSTWDIVAQRCNWSDWSQPDFWSRFCEWNTEEFEFCVPTASWCMGRNRQKPFELTTAQSDGIEESERTRANEVEWQRERKGRRNRERKQWQFIYYTRVRGPL